MRKKVLYLLVAGLCSGILLTGCNGGNNSTPKNNVSNEETNAETNEETNADANEETDADANAETNEETNTNADVETNTDADVETDSETNTDADAETDADANAETEGTTTETPDSSKESVKVPDNFVNLDKLQFSINGKDYILGKTTLQEMIDDGVPFETDDIANASNNLNSNTQSQGFKIRLGEYWTAQVYVMNDTDSNKTMSELAINEIYFPNKDDQTQDVITFAFPTNMSEEQFKKAAGKPTDVSNYEDGDFTNNRYKFTRKSTRYYSDWGYTFEFIKGKLSYFQMKYLE